MAAGAGGAGGRLLRPTAKAFKKDGSNHKPPSSTMTTTSGGNSTTGPYRIPSLKFPFPWADGAASNKSKQTHRTGSSRRAEEQRTALIGLGGGGAAGIGISPPPADRKRMGGVFLSEEEARSVDLLLPLAYEVMRRLILRQFGATWMALMNRACWPRVAETMIHRTIVSCQSFTLIGVAGSLLGSVPCFVKGCVLVVTSFLMRFQTMPRAVDPVEIMKLLIDALDMFLVGTALLTFGMGLYTMFYGSERIQKQGRQHANSSQLGTFNLKKLKEGGASIRSITQAKTRIGHAIVLLLQAGVLEEFKTVPLSSGLDTACFAGAVLASSAGVFLLSKLT